MLTLWEVWSERGEALDVADEMRMLTMRIVLRTIIVAGDNQYLTALQDAISVLVGQSNKQLFSYFPLPRWIPLPGIQRSRKAVATLDRFVYAMIRKRRSSQAGCDDILSMLLQSRDDISGEKMADRQIRDEILTLFMAGHETTANALAWAWYMLCRYPDVQDRLIREVDQQLGGQSPAYADLSRLFYPKQIFDEILRLYPPAWIFTWQAVQEDWMGEHRIPAGAIVFFSPWVMHRLPAYWDDPERFSPDRFAGEKTAALPRFTYLPFGAGARRCMGTQFAALEAVLTIIKVAQRFQLSPQTDQPVKPKAFLTLRPEGPILVTAHRRNG